jgi:hypothetical protein
VLIAESSANDDIQSGRRRDTGRGVAREERRMEGIDQHPGMTFFKVLTWHVSGKVGAHEQLVNMRLLIGGVR